MTDYSPEDRELVEALQAGDLDALGLLYDRYYPQVFRTALGITHDQQAAEDILQETFLRMHRYANRIDTSLPLAPWLYRVTVNLSYTWTKKNRRYWASIETFVDRLVAAPRNAPERHAERSELHESLQEAIDSLNFNQRVVIVMHYLNGLSLQEIAETLECPVGTVKSRLFHARANLRNALGREVPMPSDFVHGYT